MASNPDIIKQGFPGQSSRLDRMSELILPDPGERVLAVASISPRIFHPHKLLILKILYVNDQVEFRELKYDLKTTDGNLASILRGLGDDGLVKMIKREMPGLKARVLCEITPKGREIFGRIVTSLQE